MYCRWSTQTHYHVCRPVDTYGVHVHVLYIIIIILSRRPGGREDNNYSDTFSIIAYMYYVPLLQNKLTITIGYTHYVLIIKNIPISHIYILSIHNNRWSINFHD